MTPSLEKLIEEEVKKRFPFSFDDSSLEILLGSNQGDAFFEGAHFMHDELYPLILKMRKALEFYADEKQWTGSIHYPPDDGSTITYEVGDCGQIARDALDEYKLDGE